MRTQLVSNHVLKGLGFFCLIGSTLSLRAVSDLVKNSPFLPPGAVATAGATTPGTIELRSIIEANGGLQFSIYEPARQKSTWVGLNEKGYDFVVTGFNKGADTVTVDYQGRALTLELQKAKIVALPLNTQPTQIAMTMPAGGPGPSQNNPGPARTGPSATPPPAEEAKRLESVAQQVQARREARQRMQQQQGGTIQGAAPPPSR